MLLPFIKCPLCARHCNVLFNYFTTPDSQGHSFPNEKTEVYLSRGLEILGLSFKSTFNSVQLLSCVWLFATDGLQYATPPCPSPTPSVYSNSNPLSWWCHPTISSSVIPFSSCLQSFPASRSFPMSQLFASGGQSIGASAWWTGWISLQSKGLSTDFSNTTIQIISSPALSFLYGPTHIHTWLLKKP